MRKNYLDRLKDGVILFDGAMGTRLYEKGVFLNRCYDEVCLTAPDMVREIHREYIQAGAQVVETNSYGANSIKLAEYGLADKTELINRTAARLAREEAGDEVYVAGSVGPIGQRIEPVGKISRAEAEKAFSVQIKALVEGGADIILLETFTDIDELLFAAAVSKKVAPLTPVQAQFSMSRNKAEELSSRAQLMLARLDADKNVDAAGINCTVGPADMLDILLSVKGSIRKPLAIMPNAGFPREIDGRSMYLASPDYFAEYAVKFVEAGAGIIGGCCGTNPAHIKKMGQAVLNLSSGKSFIEVKNSDKEVKPKNTKPIAERSALGRALAEGSWISTVELVPPSGLDLTKFIEKAKGLRGSGVSCINIPDGPRASSRISALITALEIERNTGIETILHVCCRDKNLIGLQSDLLGAHAAGLRNMLLLTGDPPKVGNYPDVTGVFDVDSIGLTALTKKLNSAIDLGGSELPEAASFVLGAGINPVAAVPERELERAFKKAEAGAEFFISQPVFDAETLISFLEKIKATKVPVIAGVWPLASYRNALFLNNEVPGVVIPDDVMERMKKREDKEEARLEGVKICIEIIEKIRPYVKGIQISPPFGNIQTALDVIKGC
jgi:homocysteine S-methyltransferase